MSTTILKFEGGPLDGTERTKDQPGRNPTYRTVEGESMNTIQGDRITSSQAHRNSIFSGPREAYIVIDSAFDPETGNLVHSYQYISTQR